MYRLVYAFCAMLGTMTASVSAVAQWGVGGAKFRNCASRPMVLWYMGAEGPVHSGVVHPNRQSGFQVYEGHQFFWAEQNANPPIPTTMPGAVGAEFTATETIRLYFFYDDSTSKSVLDELEHELNFMSKYRAENGYHYVGTTWPRPPPIHEYMNISTVGQVIEVDMSGDQKTGQYSCNSEFIEDCVDGRELNGNATQAPPHTLEIEVISTKPKVVKISNFLTDFEADYIVKQAIPLLHRSTVGDGKNAKVDQVRTSQSAWLPRAHSKVLDGIYQRVAYAANIAPERMYNDGVENLNVLHYPKRAEYTPHFDWAGDGQVESRFMTALMYLNNPARGGGTSFPKAIMPDGTIGAKVTAHKGTLVLFYHLLEDGNADELSLHAGLPVEDGEKWVAPMWIWDPSRNRGAHWKKNVKPLPARPPKRFHHSGSKECNDETDGRTTATC